jgi:acyl carrier protein
MLITIHRTIDCQRTLQMDMTTRDEVKALVAEILGIIDRLDSMNASTGLFGSLPELDSMAVIELIAAIQEKFGFEVDHANITMDTFETIGTLAAFVDANRPLGEP